MRIPKMFPASRGSSRDDRGESRRKCTSRRRTYLSGQTSPSAAVSRRRAIAMKAFVATIAALALVGCAQGAARTQTITQFERGQVDAAAHKQWGKLYDTLHPAQRRLIPYKDFSRCMITGDALARSFGIDTST